jgi:threonine synthase
MLAGVSSVGAMSRNEESGTLFVNGQRSECMVVLFQDYESYAPHIEAIFQVNWARFLYVIVIAITIYRQYGTGRSS